MNFSLPNEINYIIDRLNGAGFEAFCVGGCVRDMLLGLTPHDYDVASSALPQAIMSLFDRTVPTGIAHGTVTVVLGDKVTEVTTFRTESGYINHRKPRNVKFVSDIKEDLSRRDFTINAMAYHPSHGLIDCFGGQADLKNGILRAVGNPSERFHEDALRILRLFRFAARFNFTAEEKTLTAAKCTAELLSGISRERIWAELKEIIVSDHPQRLIPLIECGGLRFLGIDSCSEFCSLLELKPERNIRFLKFALCCNVCPVALANALKCDNALKDYCKNTIEVLKALPESDFQIKRALYLFGEDAVCDALLLSDKPLEGIKNITEGNVPYRIKDLAVDGKFLAKYGITGKATGQMLKRMLEHIWEHPEHNREKVLSELFLK